MNTMRARLLASSMITGMALVVSGTAAQAATATDTTAAAAEIIVTGSRIPQANLTSVSPITSVNQQELKLQGTSNIEDLINNLPQAAADFGGYESNGASGTATVDLRGVGNKRTLVLVNGTRLMPGDPTSGAVAADINIIPPALIDRVEVLTGGASAVYGSDAVAGVVNFIMKQHFEGIQIDEQTSIAQYDGGNKQVRTASAQGANGAALGTGNSLPPVSFPGGAWDGIRQTVTITGGINAPDDKGNVEFYLGYTHIEAVNQAQRDYSKCSLATNSGNYVQYCGGSSGTTATGRLFPTTGPNAHNTFDILNPPVGGLLQNIGNGYAQAFNYAPYNYFQRPDERYTAGEFSHYNFSNALDVYSSFMFLDDHSVAAIAPSGTFFGDRIFTIPCADPLLSSVQANTLCGPGPYGVGQTASAEIGRRDVEGAPRTADFEHMDYRMQIGAKGDLGDGWNYDVMGQYGRTVLTENQGGYFQYTHLLNALNVITDTRPGLPTTGTPQCAAFVSGTDKQCVPYNLWSAGGVTAAALKYLTGLAINSGSTTEQIVTATISNADLGRYGLKSPAAKDGVGFSAGYEYRSESLATFYDAAIASGDLAGFGGALKNTSGNQSDNDVFFEIRAPLVQGMAFADDLTFETGYRYANYSHGGGASAYKFGLDWQIVPDFRLRGSYDRAVRAPNVEELFQPTSQGLFAGGDPCHGAHPTLTAAQCANTFQTVLPGITAAQLANGGYVLGSTTLGPLYGALSNGGHGIANCPASQCGAFSGGNPNLVPEQADTYSFGFVFTPTFFKNFSLSVDYWNINIAKAIINLPGEVLLTNCGVLNNAFDCAQIQRFAAGGYTVFGGLTTVYGDGGGGVANLRLVNASALKTDGVDVNAYYRLNLEDMGVHGAGSVAFNLTGTYTNHLTTVLPDKTQYECAGLFGVTCGIPTPHWRHEFRVSWNSPWNATFSLNWRFIGGTALDFNTSQPDLQDGKFKDTLKTDAHIPDYSYIDLAVNWRVRDHFGVRAGINNVFDVTPPLLDANSFGISAPPFGNGNTYPQVYDPLGRVFFLGLTADF
ncbi:MAG: TonB-dependent receptor domain-containing protein [Caulobacterales bacterium]